MADIVNIFVYNSHVYQHYRKKKAKIKHFNPRNLKITFIFEHTSYVHNWKLPQLVRITNSVVFVNCIHECWNPQFKVPS